MSEPAEASSARDVAVRWVRAVMDERNLGAAWPLTEPELRLVLVQHWILSHHGDEVVGPPQGWDDLATALAACPSAHPLWDRFASERLKRWRQHWLGFSARTWDLRDGTERPRADAEVITFIEAGQKLRLGPGPPVTYRRLCLRRTGDEWLLAGVDGTNLFRPGWPPSPA